MGRWGLFGTLFVTALPAAAICYQLFVFITNYSGNARTLHQVIAYGTGVMALVVIGLPLVPLVKNPGGPGATKAKDKKKKSEEEDEAFAADGGNFEEVAVAGDSAEIADGELVEDLGSGEIEEAGSGEFASDEFVDATDADSGEVFEDVLDEDEDDKRKK